MYHSELTYDRDLDPELRGTVDFDFFGDENDSGRNSKRLKSPQVRDRISPNGPSRPSPDSSSKPSKSPIIGSKARVINDHPSGSEGSRHSSSISSRSSSDNEDEILGHDLSDAFSITSKGATKASSIDSPKASIKSQPLIVKKTRSKSSSRSSSPPRSNNNKSPSVRSISKSRSQYSSSSSRSRSKSSSLSRSQSRSHSSSPPPPPPQTQQQKSSPMARKFMAASSSSSSLSAGEEANSRSVSPVSSKTSSSLRIKSTTSSINDRNSATKPSNILEQTILTSDSEVTDVSPLSSPENRSPKGSPQILRRQTTNGNKQQNSEAATLINFTQSDIQRIAAESGQKVNNNRSSHQGGQYVVVEDDEDKLDMELLINALLELRGSSKASKRGSRPPWIDSLSHNQSFKPNQCWEIDRENERLLQSLLKKRNAKSASTTVNNNNNNNNNQYIPRRPHHSTVNRQKEQRKIEMENQYMVRRLRAIQPTPTMTRDYQLKAYNQQCQYGVPVQVKSGKLRLRSRPITRDPLTRGLGGYSGDRRDRNDNNNTSMRKSHTHRGMGSTRSLAGGKQTANDNDNDDDEDINGDSINLTSQKNVRRRPMSAGIMPSQSSTQNNNQYKNRPPPSQQQQQQQQAQTSGDYSASRNSSRPPSAQPNRRTHGGAHGGGAAGASGSGNKRYSNGGGTGSESSDISSRVVSSRTEWYAGW